MVFDMRKHAWIVIPLLLLIGAVAFDGVSILRSQYFLKNSLLTPPLSPHKESFLNSALDQKFYFLNKGSTQVGFVSEDGQYVLKLFLHPRYECTPQWLRMIPGMSALGAKRKALKMRRRHFEGCINAYQLLPEETGLIYYHFSPTAVFNKKITLIDQLGNTLTVDLDVAEYYLQKKATVSADYLKALPFDAAKEAVKKLLKFTTQLYEQGVVMVDLQLESNFGFIDGEPLRLDIEHFAINPKWKMSHSSHLKTQIDEFRSWLADNYPDLIPYIQ